MENECFDNKIIHPMWTHWEKKILPLGLENFILFFFHFNNKNIRHKNFLKPIAYTLISDTYVYIEENEEKKLLL